MTSILWYPGHEILVRDVVRAENCSLWNSTGARTVDLESGVWCTVLGHGHPRIRRALLEQSSALAHTGFGYTHVLVARAADEILELLGLAGGRCVFLCSGSEAVEYGVRVAQTIVGRRRLLTMADSYFGAYGSAARKSPSEWLTFDWRACAASGAAAACQEGCPHWEAIPFDDLGGFLFEPGSSSGMVRFPPAPLVRALVAKIREQNGLLLVNEVTTGVGRTGRWFGYEHYDLVPDVVALGKGIGNGYPVSVAAFAPGIVERFGGAPLKYAQSHQNDPLGAAVAREVVRTIRDEGLIARGAELAAFLTAGLQAIQARTGRIAELRGRGLMLAIELLDDPETTATIRIHRELARRGYLVGRRPGVPVLRLDPSLTIERADLEGFLANFEEVL